jgi:TDG/mug DNA glycosylase family protein
MVHSTGFPPIVDSEATLLILGSLPSVRSIEAFEYYAHPQNAFWRIMGAVFHAGRDLPYDKRTALLRRNQVAVWDVLASSVRPGSMDSDIDRSTATPNDFSSFLTTYSGIRQVCFNGQIAAAMFEKLVLSEHPALGDEIRYVTLPSTSPAYASMSFDEKLRKWSIVLKCKSTGFSRSQ